MKAEVNALVGTCPNGWGGKHAIVIIPLDSQVFPHGITGTVDGNRVILQTRCACGDIHDFEISPVYVVPSPLNVL